MYTRGFMIFNMVTIPRKSPQERLWSYSLGSPLNNKGFWGIYSKVNLLEPFFVIMFDDHTVKAFRLTYKISVFAG